MRLLQSHGIDFSSRSFAELYEEVYEKRRSRLQAEGEGGSQLI